MVEDETRETKSSGEELIKGNTEDPYASQVVEADHVYISKEAIERWCF